MPRHRIIKGLRIGESPLRPVEVRLFICIDHDGFNGSSSHRSSYVIAADENHAKKLLDEVLIKAGLQPFEKYRYKLHEVPLDRWTAEILADGSL